MEEKTTQRKRVETIGFHTVAILATYMYVILGTRMAARFALQAASRELQQHANPDTGVIAMNGVDFFNFSYVHGFVTAIVAAFVLLTPKFYKLTLWLTRNLIYGLERVFTHLMAKRAERRESKSSVKETKLDTTNGRIAKEKKDNK